jgi:Xaa-Pro aminopeptidase
MVLPLPSERIQAVRDLMKDRNLDALVVYSQRRGQIAYLSGYRPNYHTNSAFLCLPREGDPVLLIKFGFDMPRAQAMSWVQDIRAGHSEDVRYLFSEFAGILAERGLSTARLGWVASDETIDEMSSTLYGAMCEGLPHAHLERACDLVNTLRLRKSAAEVDALRRCAAVSELASGALAKTLAPEVEDCAASAQAVSAALAAGADRCDVILSAGPPNLSLPPSHQRFKKGNPVSLELTVEHEGYWIQICRTYSVGAAGVMEKRVFAASRDAYEAAASALRAGARASDVANAALAVVDRAGFQGCVRYGLGHGVGVDLPEPFSIDPHTSATLVDGMALVIHVGIWADGASAFVGGPLIVRPDGAEPLDHPQRELIEVA